MTVLSCKNFWRNCVCTCLCVRVLVDWNSRCLSSRTDKASGIGHKIFSSVVACMCRHVCVSVFARFGISSRTHCWHRSTPTHTHAHTQPPLAVLVLAFVHNIYQYVQYITVKWTCWTFNVLYSTCQHYSVQTALGPLACVKPKRANTFIYCKIIKPSPLQCD